MTNTDLRSGRPIISAFEDLTSGERASRRLEHAAERFAPVGQLTRSAGEGTGATEGAEALIRRLLFGSIAKRVDVEGNRDRAVDRAITRGQQDTGEESTAARRADVARYADQFVARGVDTSERLLAGRWATFAQSERGLVVRAARGRSAQSTVLRTGTPAGTP